MRRREVLPGLAAALGAVRTASGQTVPRPAPALEIKFPAGAPVRISQYKGKIVVIGFIRTS